MLNEGDWRKIQALEDFKFSVGGFSLLSNLPTERLQVEREAARSYHDAAVVSYCRPFTQSKGLPILSFKSIGIKPSSTERALHERLLEYRNKVVAHTDVDRMSLVLTSSRIWEGVRYMMPHVFEEVGFEFIGDLDALDDWLRKIMTPLATFVFDLMQELPPGTRIDKAPRGADRRFGPTDAEIVALGEFPGQSL
ncbi:hypothetical protein [Sphingopyxis sp. MWB1]|uniref:hypothetical protein n=1 Tax=Sphingopyxis sp. MWB1 TaxID=1537715 RepID=UPI00051A7263|nr:hypothetical protein [Sphingopyxis sp. MWB1]